MKSNRQPPAIKDDKIGFIETLSVFRYSIFIIPPEGKKRKEKPCKYFFKIHEILSKKISVQKFVKR